MQDKSIIQAQGGSFMPQGNSSSPIQRARAGDGHGRQGPYLVGDSIHVAQSPSGVNLLTFASAFAVASDPKTAAGHGAGAMQDITTGTGAGIAPASGGCSVATLYAVKVGKRGGVKRKVLSRRRSPGNRQAVHPSHAIGSPLYGASDCPFAVAIADDAPLFESKAEFLAWAMGQDKPAPGWADNLVALGRRAARRQAGRVRELRGVIPSQSSMDDAASDAVLAVLRKVTRLDKSKPEHWSSPRFMRVIAKYAARGAFNSFVHWSSVGVTGDTNKPRSFTELTAKLAASIMDNGALDAVPAQPDLDARRAVVRWVFRVGFYQFKAALPADMRGSARAESLDAARRRCRVVAECIYGASLVDACAVSGFDSFAVFHRSCQRSNFWQSLKASRAGVSGAIEAARIAQRRYALDAAQAIKQLRATGWQSWDSERFNLRVASGAPFVRRLFDARAHALTMAKHYKQVVESNLAADNAAFESVMRGIRTERFTNLRAAVGLTARRKGAGNALDAVRIGRAKGKLHRKVADVATVALPVGKYDAVKPCAVAVRQHLA